MGTVHCIIKQIKRKKEEEEEKKRDDQPIQLDPDLTRPKTFKNLLPLLACSSNSKLGRCNHCPISCHIYFLLFCLHRADLNKDEYLDQVELVEWVHQKTQEHFKEAAANTKKIFPLVDTNNDGKWTCVPNPGQ